MRLMLRAVFAAPFYRSDCLASRAGLALVAFAAAALALVVSGFGPAPCQTLASAMGAPVAQHADAAVKAQPQQAAPRATRPPASTTPGLPPSAPVTLLAPPAPGRATAAPAHLAARAVPAAAPRAPPASA